MLTEGIKGSASQFVTAEREARQVGSGELSVYATPCMIALIEEAAWKSVSGYLEEGQGTVGTRLDISHLAPTPAGMEVRAETVLSKIDGRRLVFDVKVYDEKGLIGEGTHERFIIVNEKFQAKADSKKA